MIYSVGTNTEEVIEVEENIIAFEDAEEIFFNDNGSLDIERSGEVSDLLLQLLNIEAPF